MAQNCVIRVNKHSDLFTLEINKGEEGGAEGKGIIDNNQRYKARRPSNQKDTVSTANNNKKYTTRKAKNQKDKSSNQKDTIRSANNQNYLTRPTHNQKETTKRA